jgi:seryl-tRNA synthetase
MSECQFVYIMMMRNSAMQLTIQPTVYFAAKKGSRAPGKRTLERLNAARNAIQNDNLAQSLQETSRQEQIERESWNASKKEIKRALKGINLTSNGESVSGLDLLALIPEILETLPPAKRGGSQNRGLVRLSGYFSKQQDADFKKALDILLGLELVSLPTQKYVGGDIALTEKWQWVLDTF